MNLLLTTLGMSWAIVPELLGFSNPQQLDLYAHHQEAEKIASDRKSYDIQPVNEIWIVTTGGSQTTRSIATLQSWHQAMGLMPPLRIFQAESTHHLRSPQECRWMKELILRVVLQAHARVGKGQVLLSLTGGRKTMSADMQQAASFFGCHALLHVIDQETIPQALRMPGPSCFLSPFPQQWASIFMPVVVSGQYPKSIVLSYQHPVAELHERFPLPECPENALVSVPPQTELCDYVNQMQKESQYVFVNHSRRLRQESPASNFLALYHLPPQQIQALKERKFGVFPEKQQEELAWLQQLPKAELHCHFGGAASAKDMIAIARAHEMHVTTYHKALQDWRQEWEPLVRQGNFVGIRDRLEKQKRVKESNALKAIRQSVEGVPGYDCVSAFILLFAESPELLDAVIYGPCQEEKNFFKIGIDRYEALGDLQGSALLQTRETIQKACRLLLEKACQHQVRYLEIRCSPVNYTHGGLNDIEVVRAIQEVCQQYKDRLITKLIFVASRHGKMSTVYQHIELAEAIWKQECDPADESFLIGFDLAGNEEFRKAREMRSVFMPLLQRCARLTIHAGETDDASSIWEAVYLLGADRIGHGLTLKDKPELLQRFIDRRITLEMCPSSNFQIIGFRDNYLPESSSALKYPLKEYLEKGLKVTVNTDNPGISRTDFTNELQRAARLTPGGLSAWEILQLLRNSFRAAFVSHRISKELILEAEAEILEIFKKTRLAI